MGQFTAREQTEVEEGAGWRGGHQARTQEGKPHWFQPVEAVIRLTDSDRDRRRYEPWTVALPRMFHQGPAASEPGA
jgi:hypothetical protein